MNELEDQLEEEIRKNDRLSQTVAYLQAELRNKDLLVAYAIMKNGGKLEISDEFILDYSDCEFVITKHIRCDKLATVFCARTKSNSFNYF